MFQLFNKFAPVNNNELENDNDSSGKDDSDSQSDLEQHVPLEG